MIQLADRSRQRSSKTTLASVTNAMPAATQSMINGHDPQVVDPPIQIRRIRAVVIRTTTERTLNRCQAIVVGFLWIAPLIGALENNSLLPLLLWAAPWLCVVVVHRWRGSDSIRQQLHQVAAGFTATVAVTALIHLGLQPVGGLTGPGGWFFWVFLAGLCLSILKVRCHSFVSPDSASR